MLCSFGLFKFFYSCFVFYSSPTGRGGASPSQKDQQKEHPSHEGGLKTAKSGATQVTQPSMVAESVDSAKKEGSTQSESAVEEKKTSRPRYIVKSLKFCSDFTSLKPWNDG